MKLIQVLSERFNFTMQIIECGFKWGRKLPNGSWDGIIGKLLNDVGTFNFLYMFDKCSGEYFAPQSLPNILLIKSPTLPDLLGVCHLVVTRKKISKIN